MISVSMQHKQAVAGSRYFDLTQDAVVGKNAITALLNLHINQDVLAHGCFLINTGPVEEPRNLCQCNDFKKCLFEVVSSNCMYNSDTENR